MLSMEWVGRLTQSQGRYGISLLRLSGMIELLGQQTSPYMGNCAAKISGVTSSLYTPRISSGFGTIY